MWMSLAAAELALAPHDVQAAAEAPPVAAKYLPAAQFMQTVEPAASEYLPAPHDVQAASAVAPGVSRYLPASHPWRG